MWTSNFGRVNANKIYSFAMSDKYDFDTIRKDLEADWFDNYDLSVRDYIDDMIVDDYNNTIDDVKLELLSLWFNDTKNQIDKYIYRIMQYGFYSNKDDRYYYLNINIQSGYYEWALFDWSLSEDEDDTPKTIYNKFQSLIKKVEKIFEKHTTPLKQIAQFSNWETIYAKA